MKDQLQPNFDNVDKAFSAQAPLFDAYEQNNVILQWMRSFTHKHIEYFLRSQDSIVDINAGTGIDAIHFALRGHSVTAIDIADGMVSVMETKVAQYALSEKVTVKKGSFTDLSFLKPKKFHHAISNFGGINCLNDLSILSEQLHQILYPGAMVTLVVMPKICPWEMLHALKGNFSLSFRRLHSAVNAHVEGHNITTFYHSVSDVRQNFGKNFEVVSIRGLASISPPPYMERFPQQFPSVYRTLTRIDETLSTIAPFNRWADHVIITLRKFR